MTRKPTLIVIAKAPRLGQGKSRLAREVGRVEALRINRLLHKLTARAAFDPRWRTILCVTPDRDVGFVLPGMWSGSPPSPPGEGAEGGVKLRALVGARAARRAHYMTSALRGRSPALQPAHVAPHPTPCPLPWRGGGGLLRQTQGPGDLGARLARALAPHRSVAVVGTDCPAMTRAHVAAAFRALRRRPFALGAAEDGGFWILAARDGAAAARVMHKVRWSSQHAAADVVAALGKRSVALIATLRDVDTLDDWRAYRSAIRESRGA